MIFGTCMKYLKNVTLSEDTSQEVYLLLAKKLKSHEVESFRPWLYVMVKNFCFDQLRSKKRKYEKESEAMLMYSEQVFHPYDEDTKQKDDEKKLQECIERLNHEQRQCVIEFYYEKKSYNQMAKEMMISWGMIRSRIQNARRNLKNCLDNG